MAEARIKILNQQKAVLKIVILGVLVNLETQVILVTLDGDSIINRKEITIRTIEINRRITRINKITGEIIITNKDGASETITWQTCKTKCNK